MPYITKVFPSQTISTSGPSAASSGIALMDDCNAITFFAPVLTTTALIVQVEPTDTGANWVDLKSGANNVLVLTTGATVINPPAARQMRLITTSTEASPRTIPVIGQFLV